MSHPPSAYIRATEVKSLVFAELSTPMFIRQEQTSGQIQDIPFKELTNQARVKILIEVVKDVHQDSVNFDHLQARMSENDYLNMPAPFRSKMNLRTDYKMQIAVVKTGESLFTVLKHYTFESKTPSLKNVQDMVYGEPYLIDFSPCYKYGPLALQLMLERMSTWMASRRRKRGGSPVTFRWGSTTDESMAPGPTSAINRLNGPKSRSTGPKLP